MMAIWFSLSNRDCSKQILMHALEYDKLRC